MKKNKIKMFESEMNPSAEKPKESASEICTAKWCDKRLKTKGIQRNSQQQQQQKIFMKKSIERPIAKKR